MAITANEQSEKLMLKLVTGETADGKQKCSDRSFADVNPAISNDDLYAVGAGLAGLQTNPLAAIRRQTTVTLVEE